MGGFLTPEDGTDGLYRNVRKKLLTTRCVITHKSSVLERQLVQRMHAGGVHKSKQKGAFPTAYCTPGKRILKIFAVLVCYAALFVSYRRFGRA